MGFPVLSVASTRFSVKEPTKGQTVYLNDAVCSFVNKALDQAKSEGRNVMLELATVPGNFICARPDSTAFNVDSTQPIPTVH